MSSAVKTTVSDILSSIDEALPNGSIVHWSECAPKDIWNQVPVTCGLCGYKRLVPFTSRQRKLKRKSEGLCRKCAVKKFFQDETLRSGSVIHWSEREYSNQRSRVWVTCGGCSKKRLLKYPDVDEKRLFYTGLCNGCGSRKRTQDETHASGTIIHWRERDPKHGIEKIAITCCGCNKKRFAWYKIAKSSTWSGLCHTCYVEQGSPKKFRHVETLPTGSIIHWLKRDPNNPKRVMVTCGKCEQKRFTSPPHGKDKLKWTGYCREHFTFSFMIADKIDQHGQWNSNSASSVDVEKRRRGPKKGSNAIITDDALRSAFSQLGGHATQEEVAEFLKVTDRAIRDWQKPQGLKWREVQQRLS